MLRLDAYAELHVLYLIAGVRVEIIGSALVELVTLAQFATHNNPDSQGCDTCRKPTNGAQDPVVFAGVETHALFDLVPEFAERTMQPHGLHDIATHMCLCNTAQALEYREMLESQ